MGVSHDQDQPTVLVVEDETLTRLMLGAELEARGYGVIEAANADEALLILRGNPSVKLLFTDVNMPGVLDGLALAQLARAEHPGVKVIIASGHMQLSEWAVDADAMFPKPYDLVQLIARIGHLLNR
jgi:CheY-like chemotaxis protein